MKLKYFCLTICYSKEQMIKLQRFCNVIVMFGIGLHKKKISSFVKEKYFVFHIFMCGQIFLNFHVFLVQHINMNIRKYTSPIYISYFDTQTTFARFAKPCKYKKYCPISINHLHLLLAIHNTFTTLEEITLYLIS